ncbi:short-chain dehydrogenase/reductase [Verticillium dahliae]
MIKLAKNSHRTAQARPSSSQRVISPVSDAHRHAGNSNIGTASLKTTSEIPSVLGYSNRSKLARILSQGHLAENRPVLMVVAIQPDVAFTNLTEGSSRWFAG